MPPFDAEPAAPLDEFGELLLPLELQQLELQLRDDASRLAAQLSERMPATRTPLDRPLQRPRRFGAAMRLAALGSVAAAVVLIWTFGPTPAPLRRPDGSRPTPSVATHDAITPTGAVELPWQELSSPELEGALDALEGELTTTLISI